MPIMEVAETRLAKRFAVRPDDHRHDPSELSGDARLAPRQNQ